MVTKAAKEFIQRKPDYDPDEDGLSFQSWYDAEDVKRIISPQFLALDPLIKKEIITPYVFFDGSDSLTLEDRLEPLVDELYKSDKKYYPFIFKPEIASVHYVAGFLRKNNDEEQSISIILFNPTGTTLRVDYGDYGYQLRLIRHDNDSDDELQESETESLVIDNRSEIYVEIKDGVLQYTLLNSDIDQITNSFTHTQLQEMDINIDLSIPLSVEVLNDVLKPNLAKILEETFRRGETEEKIKIISSPHKIQTIQKDKDAGRLSSCGPISVAFISYVMEHPEYMETVDDTFQLPSFLSDLLKSDDAEYKNSILTLRQQHYEYLQTVPDDLLSVIEEDHYRVTAAIISSCDEKIATWSVTDNQDDFNEYDDYLESHDVQDEDTLEELNEHSDAQDKDALEQPRDEHQKYDEISDSKKISIVPSTVSVENNNPENRTDIQFVRKQIQRYRDNDKSIFSINNKQKADALENALNEALNNKITDVRMDSGVQAALAMHRMFSFFGSKTTATKELEDSLKQTPTL